MIKEYQWFFRYSHFIVTFVTVTLWFLVLIQDNAWCDERVMSHMYIGSRPAGNQM